MRLVPIAAAFGAALFSATTLEGQSVRGVVTDDDTDRAIALVTVVAVSGSGEVVASMLTDSTGFFSLDLPDGGQYVVRASALGYSAKRQGPLELESDDVRILYFDLAPRPIELAGLTVEADAVPGRQPALIANGFAERYLEGKGQFLTPNMIANSDAFFTPELFEEMEYVYPEFEEVMWARWVRVDNPMGAGRCRPTLFLDGRLVPEDMLDESWGLDDLVQIEDLLAAELFRGPFVVPSDFSGSTVANDCATLLLWTKTGGGMR